jgi:exonuclease SbcC
MKILSLELGNFRVFEEAQVTFATDGITGIIGQNGHGKTSILEGLAWALFGAEATRGTMAGVRWNRAPARRTASADLVFGVGGQRYHIGRTESDATLEEIHDGYEIVIAAGTSAVNARIPELLGMSYREWSTTYLCQQRDLARLASMGPTARQQFMREVLGVSRIDEALKACRERKNAIATEVEGVRAGLGDRAPLEAGHIQAIEAVDRVEIEEMPAVARAAKEAEAAHHSAAESLRLSDVRRQRHAELTGRLEESRRLVDEAEGSIEKLEQGMQQAREARARVDAAEGRLSQLPTWRAEREELRVAEARAASRASLEMRIRQIAGSCQAVDESIAAARESIAAHDADAWERLKTSFADARSKLEDTRNTRIRQYAEMEAAHKAARRRFDSVQNQYRNITEAGEHGACPTCTRALGDQYHSVVGALQRDHEEAAAEMTSTHATMAELQEPSDEECMIEASFEDLRSRGEAAQRRKVAADEAEKQLRRSTAERERLEQSAAGVESELATIPAPANDGRLDIVLSEISALEELDRSLAGARNLAGRVAVLGEQIDGWQGRLSAAREKQADARSDIDRLQFDPAQHAEQSQAALAARSAWETAREDLIRTEQALRAARGQLETATEALERYDARAGRLTDLQAQLATHTASADGLNALRVWAAGQIRPELEELTSGFVALLTDGRHEAVTIGEDFSVTLHESGVPVEIVSGGTEDVAAIAQRLAVSQMIAQRAGHPLSLLILDEPFGSLDQTRRGNVLSLIRRLRSIFSQVLLISHVEETREAVDHAIEVTYSESEGRSTVHQARQSEPAEVVAA